MCERIGLLLVHGIGEQCRFEHLENEARRLARAFENHEEVAFADVNVHTSPGGELRAQNETWRDDTAAPVTIEIKRKNDGSRTCVDIREVWWADLDERSGLLAQIRFWWWALSMWATRRYTESSDHGIKDWMTKVDTGRVPAIARIRLFVVSIVMFIPVLILSLVNLVGRNVFRIQLPGPGVITDFVGDVMLYQKKRRRGKGPLVDVGCPPRVTIRRRLAQAMVRMALGGYDRWYILAHSLGSVVAFNGLMDPAQRLPHYLDEELWKFCKEDAIAGTSSEPLTPEEMNRMKPKRPPWLAPDSTIDRAKLFEKLHGVMTYGSPVEKFAVLWPMIVPINNDKDAFRPDFEWINVVDHTDPVAGRATKHTKAGFAPREVDYKCTSFHLPSHTRYMDYVERKARVDEWSATDERRRKKVPNGLSNAVATWVLSGGSFPIIEKGSWRWPDEGKCRFQTFLRIVGWLLAAALLLFIAAFVIAAIDVAGEQSLNWAIFKTAWTRVPRTTLNVLKWTAVLTFVVGIVDRVFREIARKKRKSVSTQHRSKYAN